jgi:hypothetical protein
MKEHRCINSGALLFTPGPGDLETIRIREDNKALSEKVDRLEKMVINLLENKDV